MNIDGLEVNSPEYWEIRHQREDWPRSSSWAMDVIKDQIPHQAKVLIVGCGQGEEAIYIINHRPDVRIVAFDVSPTAIEKARQKLENNSHMFIHYMVADVFNLKNALKNQEFDYAFSIQNFEHWKPSTHVEALRQIWSRIKPGGKFFFTGVGRAWDLSIMNYSPMEYMGKTIQAPNDYHYNNWSEQDVYDLFMKDPIQAKTVTFWRLRRNNRVVAEAQK